MLITVNGLITREYRTGDKDRVLHIITHEEGRLSAIVKGSATRKKDATVAATQLFTYANFELYRGAGGDLYWIRSVSPIRHFFGLSEDIVTMALASYLCDVATDLAAEEDAIPETDELLRMLLNTLHVLNEKRKPHALVKAVFEMRLAAMMGFQPDLTGCVLCGNGYPDAAYMDIMNGCLICADCQTKRNREGLLTAERLRERERELGERRIVCPLTASTLAALRYTLAAPEKKIFSFALQDPDEVRRFGHVAETYLLNQLEQDFDTLRFYRSVADP